MIPFLLTALLAAPQSGGMDALRTKVIDAEVVLAKQAFDFRPCSEPSMLAEIKIPLKTVDDQPVPQSPIRLRRTDISGQDEPFEIQLLLHRIAFMRTFGMIDYESLHVTAVPVDKVHFEARVIEACWDAEWTPAKEPVTDVQAMYTRRLQQLQAQSGLAAQIAARMQPLRVTDALEIVAEAWAKEPVRLGEASWNGAELTLNGVALGTPAGKVIDPAMRKAGLEPPKIDWSAWGDCNRFRAAARLSPKAPPEREASVDNVFDERIASLCNTADAGPAKRIEARGSGTLTVRARGIDLATAFMILNELDPAHGFVVEEDVAGRVDLDLRQVRTDEALHALEPLAKTTAGPIHRVCKSECVPPRHPAESFTGEPISLLVTSADVLDIFRVFRQITGLDMYAKELPGKLSVYVKDVAWDRIFDAVVAAAHRTYSLEGTKLLFDRDGVPIDKLIQPGWRPLFAQNDPTKIAAEDVRVAAIGGAGDDWIAWARVPGASRHLFALSPGGVLLDATVKSVSADKVVLRQADGREIALPLK